MRRPVPMRRARDRHVLPCSPTSPSLPSRPKRSSDIRTPLYRLRRSSRDLDRPAHSMVRPARGIRRRARSRAALARRLHARAAVGRRDACRASSSSRRSTLLFPGRRLAAVVRRAGQQPAGAAQPRYACGGRGGGAGAEGHRWPAGRPCRTIVGRDTARPRRSRRVPRGDREPGREFLRRRGGARSSGWSSPGCPARSPTRRSTPPTA